MILDIVSGVCQCLYKEFGDGYKIYKENISQNMRVPSFLVTCINPTTELFLGKRYICKNQICVQYFPESECFNHENIEICERLFSCLEFLPVDDDVVMGSGVSVQQVDGVLSFFISYNFFVNRLADVSTMDVLERYDSNIYME